MRPPTFSLLSTLLIITLLHDSDARLIGTRWWRRSSLNIEGAAPVSNKDSDTKIQQGVIPAANRPTTIRTGTLFFATLFDVDEDENSDDACYDCCCDRDVVCNYHGKSEALCHKNACDNGATCQSEGYICPSYDCDEEEIMW